MSNINTKDYNVYYIATIEEPDEWCELILVPKDDEAKGTFTVEEIIRMTKSDLEDDWQVYDLLNAVYEEYPNAIKLQINQRILV